MEYTLTCMGGQEQLEQVGKDLILSTDVLSISETASFDMVAESKAGTAEQKVVARVYFIRHGETQENRDGIVQGQLDTKLNKQGQWQASMLGAYPLIHSLRIAKMMSSDLSRAVETAEHALVRHPDVRLMKQPQLRERRMGKLEGTKGGWGLAQALRDDPTAETTSQFTKRAVDWWKREVADWCRSRAHTATANDDGPRDIVVMTHGGFITTLVQALLGSRQVVLDDGVVVGRCYNTSVTEIDMLGNGRGILRSFGRISHLEGRSDSEPLGSNADVDGST